MKRFSHRELGPGLIALTAIAALGLGCTGQGPQQNGAPENARVESPEPSKPATPRPVRITVPRGTEIGLTLSSDLGSSHSQVGDTFTARTTDPVVVGDRVAIPAGSTVTGQVTEVVPASKGLKEKSGSILLAFNKVTTPAGNSAPLTASVAGAASSKKKTAAIIGGSAAGGALLGKVVGGSTRDAALGAVIGGAVGTGIAAGTRGTDVKLPAGTHLSIRLDQPLVIAIKP